VIEFFWACVGAAGLHMAYGGRSTPKKGPPPQVIVCGLVAATMLLSCIFGCIVMVVNTYPIWKSPGQDYQSKADTKIRALRAAITQSTDQAHHRVKEALKLLQEAEEEYQSGLKRHTTSFKYRSFIWAAERADKGLAVLIGN
jgi:hypothetical protein